MNPKLWKVLDNVPTVDDARIGALRDQAATYMESDDEYTRQCGRKIEAAIEKIVILNEEYKKLDTLITNVGRTKNDDFVVTIPRETLTMDHVSGGHIKRVTLTILADAIKINRLEYLTAYLILLKSEHPG